MLDENELAAQFYIMPDSHFKLGWDMLVAFTLAFCCVMSPMMSAFAPELELSAGWRLRWSLLAGLSTNVLIADIAVNMRTSFFDEGVHIRLPRLIAGHYMSTSHFKLDVLAALPLRLLLAGSAWRGMERRGLDGFRAALRDSNLFELVCLWDLFKLEKLMRKLEKLDLWLNFHSAFTQLVKLFLGLGYMWLWMGMMYFYIGTVETERQRAAGELTPGSFGPHNWNSPTDKVTARIIRSVFWGISVTAGIGPDIEPETFVEVVFTSVCSLMSILVYALTIGSASAAISDLQAPLQARRNRLEQLNDYMRYKRVPLQLRQRVSAFFDYRGLSLLGVVSDSDVMNKIPASLNAQLSVALNKSLFTQVPLFRESPANLLLAIVSRLVPLIHMPGDWIIREGTEGKALYFINRGQCVVLKKVEQHHATPRSHTASVFGAISRSRVLARFSSVHPRASMGRAPVQTQQRSSFGTSRWARLSGPSDATKRALGPKRASESRMETLAVLSDNHFFGERALLTTGLTAASVMALTYCDLMALYASDFKVFVRDFPFFASVVDMHAARLHEATMGRSTSAPPVAEQQDERARSPFPRSLWSSRAQRSDDVEPPNAKATGELELSARAGVREH